MALQHQLGWALLFIINLYWGAGGPTRARCLAAIAGTSSAVWAVDGPVALAVAYYIANATHLLASGNERVGPAIEVLLALSLAFLSAVGAIRQRRLHPYAIASFLVLVADALGLRLVAAVVVAMGMFALQRYERELIRIWVTAWPRVSDDRRRQTKDTRSCVRHPHIPLTRDRVAGIRRRPETQEFHELLRTCVGTMTALGILTVAWMLILTVLSYSPGTRVGLNEGLDPTAVALVVQTVAGLLSLCAVWRKWTLMYRIPSERVARGFVDQALRLSLISTNPAR